MKINIYLLVACMLILFPSCELDSDFSSGNSDSSCFDGIQNGAESGIDCGGDCNDCSGTFSINDVTANEGVRLLEVDDGYIVFSREKILKFDRSGTRTSSLDVNTVIPNFLFADFIETDSEDFFVASRNGLHLTIGQDLAVKDSENSQAPLVGAQNVGSVVFFENDLSYVGYSDDGLIHGPILYFWPEGSLPFILADNEHSMFDFDVFQIPISPAIPFKADDRVVVSVFEVGEFNSFGITSYGTSIGATDWSQVAATGSFKARAFADMPNANILAYGNVGDIAQLRSFGSQNGFSTGSIETICMDGVLAGDIESVSDGYVLLSTVQDVNGNCTSDNIDGFRDIKLQKLDIDFNEVWSRVYNFDDNQEAYDLIQTSDNGFAVVGRTRLSGRDQLIFIKTDEEGRVN